MLRRTLASLLFAALVALAPAGATEKFTVSTAPTCGATDFFSYAITDGANEATCSTGSGSAKNTCLCEGGTRIAVGAEPVYVGAQVHDASLSLTTSIWAQASFDTETYDALDWHVGGSPTRVTVTKTGKFQIIAHAIQNSATWSAGTINIQVESNGSGSVGSGALVVKCGNYNGGTHNAMISCPVESALTSGDYLELWVISNSSTGSKTVIASLSVRYEGN